MYACIYRAVGSGAASVAMAIPHFSSSFIKCKKSKCMHAVVPTSCRIELSILKTLVTYHFSHS